MDDDFRENEVILRASPISADYNFHAHGTDCLRCAAADRVTSSVTPLARAAGAMLCDLYAVPESDMVADAFCDGVWMGICPCSILVDRSADANVEISRRALDRADGRMLACFEQAPVYRARWKIVVAFDDDRFVAAGDRRVFPNR